MLDIEKEIEEDKKEKQEEDDSPDKYDYTASLVDLLLCEGNFLFHHLF